MINNELVILILLIVIVSILCINKETFTNIIVRPLDFTSYEQTGCKAPLYNDKPGLKFCNKQATRYYDTRYLNGYDNYYDMITNLVKMIGTNNEIINNKLQETTDCDVADYQVRELLNNKIASTIKNNNEFHNNGSFKLENFTVTDVNLKYYIDSGNKKYIKALFTLYDLTRSAGTDAYALLYLDPELTVQTAGIIPSNFYTHNSKMVPVEPLGFDIYDSLINTNLSSYVKVPPGTTIEGGISPDMQEIIDLYYQYN